MNNLKKTDKEVYNLIKKEEERQKNTLMMIPSENIASKAVLEALGSCLTNKYAEGYPGKRYYQGNVFVDQIENLAVERAKKLFGVPYANVQPYSGSPANLAIYLALMKPGEKIMGLSLSSGGHLTHGAPASFTGKLFQSVPYHVNQKGLIDYEELKKIALKEKPKIIIAGITAYSRILNWKKFAEIAQQVDAYLVADISHLAGLIVAGCYPSPKNYADIIMTTTHKTLRGPRGAIIMVTNKGIKKNKDLTNKIQKAVFPGLQGGPHLNNIAAIAVCLKEAQTLKFKKYIQQVIKNAKILAEELKKYHFNLISGGTDSHLVLVDLRNKNILGNTAAEALEEAGIIVNRNAIFNDPNPPFYPSGLRMGTPGITTRGIKEKEIKLIAKWINETIEDVQKTKEKLQISLEQEKDKQVRKQIINSTTSLKKINKEVKKLCQKFPIR